MTPHGVVLAPIAGLGDKVDLTEKLTAKEKIFKELVEIKGSITNLNHKIGLSRGNPDSYIRTDSSVVRSSLYLVK